MTEERTDNQPNAGFWRELLHSKVARQLTSLWVWSTVAGGLTILSIHFGSAILGIWNEPHIYWPFGITPLTSKAVAIAALSLLGWPLLGTLKTLFPLPGKPKKVNWLGDPAIAVLAIGMFILSAFPVEGPTYRVAGGMIIGGMIMCLVSYWQSTKKENRLQPDPDDSNPN